MNTTNWRQYTRLILSAAALTALGACGGGGEGNLSGGITYSGNANPAVLSTGNGADLITEAYTAGANGSAVGDFAGTLDTQSDIGKAAPARPLTLYRSVSAVMAQLSPASAADSGPTRALQSRSDTFPSQESCGGNTTPTGNVQSTFSYDDVTGDFDGNAIFTSFCAGGQSISGSATLSGRLDVATQDFIGMTISTNGLTVISGSDNYAFKGEVNIELGAGSQTVSMDLLFRDNATQKTVWLNNFVLAVSSGTNSELISASGRYYNPDEGYVTLATPTPLEIMQFDDWPSAGTLTATGANGKVTLSALSNTVYRVDVDIGDDGSVESTVTGNWADL